MPYKHQVIPLQTHEGNETAEQALHSIVDGFKRFRNEVFPQQEGKRGKRGRFIFRPVALYHK